MVGNDRWFAGVAVAARSFERRGARFEIVREATSLHGTTGRRQWTTVVPVFNWRAVQPAVAADEGRQLSVGGQRAGAARLDKRSAGAARPRQCYYRPAGAAFAAERPTVGRTLALGILGSVVGDWSGRCTTGSWHRTKKIVEARCFTELAAVQPAVAADDRAAEVLM